MEDAMFNYFNLSDEGEFLRGNLNLSAEGKFKFEC